MRLTLSILTLISVLVCATILVLIFKKQTAHPVPATWDYTTFEWHELEFDSENHSNQVQATFLNVPDNNFWKTEYGETGMEAMTVNDILREAGSLGWELVSFDGKQYILKHPSGDTNPHSFYVTRQWIELHHSPQP